jgi:hypothetical protein
MGVKIQIVICGLPVAAVNVRCRIRAAYTIAYMLSAVALFCHMLSAVAVFCHMMSAVTSGGVVCCCSVLSHDACCDIWLCCLLLPCLQGLGASKVQHTPRVVEPPLAAGAAG